MSSAAHEHILRQHPLLGSLRGVGLPGGVHQFRNVLYATIPGRWMHSRVVEHLSPYYGAGSSYDATSWGPIPPQPSDSIEFDFSLIQSRLPVEHPLTCDENKCLNLVISVPAVKTEAPLPIVVFIHGGGFLVGCNAWPQYDLAKLVELSIHVGRPVIGIAINYRLGLLGYMASKEISEEPIGNFGLLDQANAFKWIQRNVMGFGGDPSNVTVFGESAGAISVWMHLLRGEPLFKRAMAMSGSPHLRRPLPPESNELVYHALLEELNAVDLSISERERILKGMPWQSFVNSALNNRCFPTLRGGFEDMRKDPTELKTQIQGCLAWCKTIVIGDCELDASAFRATIDRPDYFDEFKNSFREIFSDEEIQEIMDAYNLETAPSTNDPCHMGLLQFTTDVRFYMPVVLASEVIEPEDNLRVYHFHEPNPFDGPFKGRTGHVLDVAYTLQTYQHVLPKEAQEVSRRMGQFLLDLAHGMFDERDATTDKTGCAREVMLHDHKHVVQRLSGSDYDRQHRDGVAPLLKKLGVDRLMKALDLYQFGFRT